jgi:unsaturated rhamnogalacturonyl hydrolase
MISFIKKVYFVTLTISLTAITSNCQQSNPIQEEGMAVKIADSFIGLHPDTVAYKTEAKSYKWNYEQGLMLEAFYQLYKLTDDEKYLEYIKKNIDYYVEDDGNIKTYNMKDFNIDNVSPGRVLLHLYTETKNEKYKKAADTLIKQLEIHPRTSEGGFWHKKIYPNQMWLDGLYMAEPFYTRYAVMFDEKKILNDVANQFMLIEKNLKDEKTGLYYHGWDESKEQKWADPVTGKSPNFWGRAIGWFMMALVDVLDYFPQDHYGRENILTILQNLSESLLDYRDEEKKLWWQIVDQGSREGNYIEASSSSMFIYAFAKGVNKGYLDKKYFDAARESFNAVLKHLVTYDDAGYFYLNNNASVGGLGGNPYRDGSFEYYISEPKRTNDFKGYGPLLLSAIEIQRGITKGN